MPITITNDYQLPYDITSEAGIGFDVDITDAVLTVADKDRNLRVEALRVAEPQPVSRLGSGAKAGFVNLARIARPISSACVSAVSDSGGDLKLIPWFFRASDNSFERRTPGFNASLGPVDEIVTFNHGVYKDYGHAILATVTSGIITVRHLTLSPIAELTVTTNPLLPPIMGDTLRAGALGSGRFYTIFSNPSDKMVVGIWEVNSGNRPTLVKLSTPLNDKIDRLAAVAAGSDMLITGTRRKGTSTLKLTAWRVGGDGGLTKLADTGKLGVPGDALSMFASDFSGDVEVFPTGIIGSIVTGIRGQDDMLRIVRWHILNNGQITQVVASAALAGPIERLALRERSNGAVACVTTPGKKLRILSIGF